MEAGYLIGKWIKSKLSTMGTNGVISWLAGKVGQTIAKKIVTKVVTVGVTAAAGYVSATLGASGSVAGPLGIITGGAVGWL